MKLYFDMAGRETNKVVGVGCNLGCREKRLKVAATAAITRRCWSWRGYVKNWRWKRGALNFWSNLDVSRCVYSTQRQANF